LLALPSAWTTARLRLRRPRESDVADVFDYASHPDVTRFMDWRALNDVDQADTFVRESHQKWESNEEFTWVVTDLASDSVIGAVSCRPKETEVDFGYVLNRSHWGKGLATELAIALVARLFADQRIARVWATCDAENVRSRRVLEKAGLAYEGLLPSGRVRPQLSPVARPACVYGRDRRSCGGV
jgi:RimJ/RimL family protein N-acetyltransferase